MKRCKFCNVDVATDKDYCPLCYNDLEGKYEGETILTQQKTKNVKKPHTNTFLAKLFLFISIAIMAVCLFVNLKTDTTYLWCLLVLEGIIYVWILVVHTIMSKRSVFEKIVFQLLGVITIISTTYSMSPSVAENWLVQYVLPSVCMFSTLVLVMISFISRDRKRYLLSFLAIYIAFIILSLVLVCTIDTYKTLNHINLLISGIASLGTVLLGYKAIHREFVKVFHL